MATSSKTYILSFTIFIKVFISLAKATKLGFTVDLIHRDSPLSPLFDNSTSSYEKIHQALLGDLERLNYLFAKYNNSISAEINQGDPETSILISYGQYLMIYSLGTPTIEALGYADTGSDLVWLQCIPCESCFRQIKFKFDPSESYTYDNNITCDSQICKSVRRYVYGISCDSGNYCMYKVMYEDRISISVGRIGFDTLTLRSTSGEDVKFPRFMFGCGYNNSGKFKPSTSGIVGLGRGKLSLVTQLSDSIEGRFSYCLAYYGPYSGKLKFGQTAVVSGPEVVSTRMESGFYRSFYYLTLEAISVGDKRLEYTPVRKGNIIIDSGTTFTTFPLEFYRDLEAAVADVLDKKLFPAEDPRGVLELCYEAESVENVGAPTITIHFSGADVKLAALNTFVMKDINVACFAFRGGSYPRGVYGNVAQLNFLIGYDLRKELVSFKPMDCPGLI